MNFKPTRASSIKVLQDFIEKELSKYSYLRNFDFGPTNRSNTSCLSPYISHGILTEVEVINKSLKEHAIVNIDKFIQEVLWRIYWKGWLELRPNVWTDFVRDLKIEKEVFLDNANYINAINGKTEIECFNDWVGELKDFNYLHNHTRMWFASIWIFTLKLPWQLGAEFFLENLYDGDVASNTLGWKWVAGLQTIGKNYIATEENIKKYTHSKYQNISLEKNANPLKERNLYSIKHNDFINPKLNEDKILLIFDNNLSFENSEYAKMKFKEILIVNNNSRKIKLSKNVCEFKNQLIKDQYGRLKKNMINCKIIDINYLNDLNEEVYALYPCVGENLDFLIENKKDNIKFLYREIDKFSWKYCNKGFFNFKNYIPEIIEAFNK